MCVCVCNVFVVVVAIAIRQTSEHNKTTFRQDSTIATIKDWLR